MYFVHSYHVKPIDESIISSYTNYNDLIFASSIKKDNIFACQFHPEKSHKFGMELLANFCKI